MPYSLVYFMSTPFLNLFLSILHGKVVALLWCPMSFKLMQEQEHAFQ